MSEKKVFWYVLFSRTGVEERLAMVLKNRFDDDDFLPFVPQKTCVFRRQGKRTLFRKVCFPGYVFIESSKSTMDFIERARPIVDKQNDAYRFLSYGDRYELAMRDEERIALSKIFGEDKHMDISTGFKDGDSVRVISGALVGKESIIQKVNVGRREAVIEVPMFGTTVSVSVGFEMLKAVAD